MAVSKTSEFPSDLAQLMREGRALLGTNADAQIDLRALTEGITGLDRARQLMAPEQLVPEPFAQQLRHAFEQRAQGVPVAYILGRRGFWRHEFQVTPDTLIPRPETEILLEWALELIPEDQPLKIADLGTGSGILSICMAAERPCAILLATDISPGALAVARRNQKAILPTQSILWILGSWADSLADESLDMVVSNPPYIPQDDPHLFAGDLRFEPQSALAAGRDGLDDYRILIHQAARVLRPSGWLLVEHGHDQAQAVQALMHQEGFTRLDTRMDFAHLSRASGGQKPSL
jgi:release factor glutamine methyltransferase